MTAQTSQVVAIPPDPGFAPDFTVDVRDVRGMPVDRTQSEVLDVRNDVLNIQVILDLNNMASFDITLNNWDDVNLRFKYSESEADTEVFKFGRIVSVRLGYADKLVPVVSGQITALRPTFPDSTSPTIGISGSDGMQALKDSKPRAGQPIYYRGKADWEIAQQVAGRQPKKMKVSVPDKTGLQHPLVVQKNQDDASFLMERARRIDYDCYVTSDDAAGTPTLHFEPSPDGRNGAPVRAFRLAYGPGLAAAEQLAAANGAAAAGGPLVPNLISFTPTLTAARQVSRVTVRGWDPRTKQSIDAVATVGNLPSGRGGGLTGPTAASEALGGREDTVIDAPVASVEEARALATALLRERAYQFITGSGRIAGLPQLRPRDVLEIHGIGRRFSGNYFVTRVEHTVGASGFFTQFGVRRIADGTKGSQ